MRVAVLSRLLRQFTKHSRQRLRTQVQAAVHRALLTIDQPEKAVLSSHDFVALLQAARRELEDDDTGEGYGPWGRLPVMRELLPLPVVYDPVTGAALPIHSSTEDASEVGTDATAATVLARSVASMAGAREVGLGSPKGQGGQEHTLAHINGDMAAEDQSSLSSTSTAADADGFPDRTPIALNRAAVTSLMDVVWDGCEMPAACHAYRAALDRLMQAATQRVTTLCCDQPASYAAAVRKPEASPHPTQPVVRLARLPQRAKRVLDTVIMQHDPTTENPASQPRSAADIVAAASSLMMKAETAPADGSATDDVAAAISMIMGGGASGGAKGGRSGEGEEPTSQHGAVPGLIQELLQDAGLHEVCESIVAALQAAN